MAQGAVLQELQVKGRPVLFPETQVVINGTLKRRGGMPLLFPNAGPLPAQTPFALPQHGFARDKAWNIVRTTADSAQLSLYSDSETEAMFPFTWSLTLAIQLQEAGVTYDLTVHNESDRALPTAPGIHPYLWLPPRVKSQLKTNLPEFNPATYNWQETLVFPYQPKVVLEIPQHGQVTLTASAGFRYWMVWSEPDRDQVCFEPWVGPEGALLDPTQALMLPPHCTAQLTLNLSFQPAENPV